MRIGVCLDCGLRLVFREQYLTRQAVRHFKYAHPFEDRYAIEMKPKDEGPEFYRRFYWFRSRRKK